jgi:hypothetical protein
MQSEHAGCAGNLSRPVVLGHELWRNCGGVGAIGAQCDAVWRRTVGSALAGGGRRALDRMEAWLAERFPRYRGNADVVRQDLEGGHDICLSRWKVEAGGTSAARTASEASALAAFETARPPAADRFGRDARLARHRERAGLPVS